MVIQKNKLKKESKKRIYDSTLNQPSFQSTSSSRSNPWSQNNSNPFYEASSNPNATSYTSYTYTKNGTTYTYTEYSNSSNSFNQKQSSNFDQEEYNIWRRILEQEQRKREKEIQEKQKKSNRFIMFILIVPITFYMIDIYFQLKRARAAMNAEVKKYEGDIVKRGFYHTKRNKDD
jgi:hypothetical protein